MQQWAETDPPVTPVDLRSLKPLPEDPQGSWESLPLRKRMPWQGQEAGGPSVPSLVFILFPTVFSVASVPLRVCLLLSPHRAVSILGGGGRVWFLHVALDPQRPETTPWHREGLSLAQSQHQGGRDKGRLTPTC